jgi:hypothetical protein
MKPLQIFRKSPDMDAYYVGGSFTPYAIVARDKRFTDAELAAEFHEARGDWIEASNHPSGTYWTPLGVEEDATADTAMKRSMVALRFATLPHYDEV